MNRKLFFVTNLMFILSIRSINAQDAMPQNIREQVDKHFVGDWSFKSDYAEAEGEGEYPNYWSKTGESVIGHQYFSIPAGKFHATVTTGWDAANKSLLTNFYANRSKKGRKALARQLA